jgi:predicted RNA-binding protein with PIN domain
MLPQRLPHFVVDAMNVIGSRPNGWWRDREAAVRRLVERLDAIASADGCDVTLVVDGRALHDLPEGIHGRVRLLYAARPGRNAADDRIIELLSTHRDPSSLDVVTSDRELQVRARACGAQVRTSRTLLERLDRLAGQPGTIDLARPAPRRGHRAGVGFGDL